MTIGILSETHDVPEWIEREIRTIGGCVDGRPRFRVIWGNNRLILGSDKLLFRPYQVNRWHLERWKDGEWHHCVKFGQCPHMKEGEKSWCKACFISGGEYVDIQSHMQIVRRAIYMLVKSDELQNAALRKNALMEREAAKVTANEQRRIDCFKDAFPTRVTNSPVTFKEPKLTKGVSRKKAKDKFFTVN